jgi:hypothetical protein
MSQSKIKLEVIQGGKSEESVEPIELFGRFYTLQNLRFGSREPRDNSIVSIDEFRDLRKQTNPKSNLDNQTSKILEDDSNTED